MRKRLCFTKLCWFIFWCQRWFSYELCGYFSTVSWEFYRIFLWRWMDRGTLLISLSLSLFVIAIIFSLYAFGFSLVFLFASIFFLVVHYIASVNDLQSIGFFSSDVGDLDGWWVIVFFHLVGSDGIGCPLIIFYISK